MKLTAEQRIERAHVALMRDKRFCLFSGLFMVGKNSVDDATSTAKTDGVNVIYGRGFVESLNDKQLAFLILHETMHKAYRHLTVWETLYKKNPMLANAACDYVINLQIKDYDPSGTMVEMPTDKDGNVIGLIDEKYRGMDAAQVFKSLEEDPPPEMGQGGDGAGLDEHDWEGAQEMSAEQAEEIAKEIDQALRQGALLAEKMNGDVHQDIKDLLTPKINWREALREFVKTVAKGHDDTTWKRYNKRLVGSDVYLPTVISTKVGRLVIGQDTSGSVCGPVLTEFMSEVKSIAEEVSPEAVEMLYWDSAVAAHETYEDGAVENLIATTKPQGGGGTDPGVVPVYLKEKNIEPECVIMLTDGEFYDGEGDWSQINAPVLWAVIGNKNFTAKRGIVLHIEEK